MTKEQFARIRGWFESYVADITPDDKKVADLIGLKRVHSEKVAGHCAAIARDEGFSGPDTRTAEALGILHDIGRFAQIVEFMTFNDTGSFNHGEYGAEIIGKSDVLAALNEPDRGRIHAGVRHHNARIVTGGLDSEALPFVNIIRDADKLDIYRVIAETIRNGDHEKHPEITLNIDMKGPPGAAALEQIRARETVSYENIKSLADFRLTELSWLYDINYRYTLRYIAENGILDEVTGSLPDDPAVNEVVREVKDFIEGKMK